MRTHFVVSMMLLTSVRTYDSPSSQTMQQKFCSHVVLESFTLRSYFQHWVCRSC